MNRWIAPLCGLTLTVWIAGIACAQAPASPPAPAPKAASAAPRVVAGSGKLELDAKEPGGLLLKSSPGKSGEPGASLRVEWGAKLPALKEAMAALPGLSGDDRLGCFQGNGETTCLSKGEAIGWADLAGVLKGPGRTALLFAPDGRFYHYLVDLPRGEFEALRSSLAASLGAPVADSKSTGQDRTGAAFDQRRILWNFSHVSVALQQTNPLHTEECEIHVVYMPIAAITQ
jgi:hypothetical protein